MIHDAESYLATHELSIAGRETSGCWDAVKQYCGMARGGTPPETWAFQYYDVVLTDPSTIERVDLLAAGALHPGLSREDLAFFAENAATLARWIDGLPADQELAYASDDLIDKVASMSDIEATASATLISKVLHRKRPLLIPLLDRHVVDRYRPITGERRPHLAWPALLPAMREDLERNRTYLGQSTAEIARLTGVDVSPLRALDIAIWMEGRR